MSYGDPVRKFFTIIGSIYITTYLKIDILNSNKRRNQNLRKRKTMSLNIDIFHEVVSYLHDSILMTCISLNKYFGVKICKEIIRRMVFVKILISMDSLIVAADYGINKIINEGISNKVKKALSILNQEINYNTIVEQRRVVILIPCPKNFDLNTPWWIERLMFFLQKFEKNGNSIVDIAAYTCLTDIWMYLKHRFILQSNVDNLIKKISDKRIYVNWNESVNRNWERRVRKNKEYFMQNGVVNLKPTKKLPSYCNLRQLSEK